MADYAVSVALDRLVDATEEQNRVLERIARALEGTAAPEATHTIVYQGANDAACSCGTVISWYGVTNSVAATLAAHIRAAKESL